LRRHFILCFLFLYFISVKSFTLGIDTNIQRESEAGSSLEEYVIFDNYDEIEYQSFEKEDVKHIKFLGNVRVRFQDKKIKSRMLIITLVSNKVIELSAFDNVELQDKDNFYLADKASIDPERKIGVLYNVRSFLKDVTGGGGPVSVTRGLFFDARKVTILGENKLVFDDAYFTFTDIEPPPYRVFSKKVWYFKGEIIYALFDAYYIGQNIFLPLPFYFRWEKFSGARTSFGQEKRIGWYLMNTIDLSTTDGNYTFYVDFYERLGQYIMVNYMNKMDIGPFNMLNVRFNGANDQRIVYDPVNDRYSQDIITESNIVTNISQLCWNYTINASLKKENINISLYWEDINDPLFKHKFISRRESFDIRQVIQPLDNSFYGASRGSLDIKDQTFYRSLSLSGYGFSLSGRWNYALYEIPDFNRYTTDRYRYYLQSVSFPKISYSPGDIPIFNISHSIPLTASNLPATPVIQSTAVQKLETNSNSVSPSAGNIVTTNIVDKTQSFTVYNLGVSIGGEFSYDSLENFNTNREPTSDSYSHNESVSLKINGDFINKLITSGVNLNFKNLKKWATDPVVNSNFTKSSGYSLSMDGNSGISYTPIFFPLQWYEITLPLSLSHNFTYEFVKTTTDVPLKSTHTTTFNPGGTFFNNQIKTDFSLTHYICYRLTNITDENDKYLNNVLERTLYLRYGINLFYFYSKHWVSAYTETKLDILETKTNPKVIWDYPEITNRIVAGYSPKIKLSFSPSEEFNPLPSFTYVYDILKNTNESLSIQSRYSLRNIYDFLFYKIEILNIDSSLYWDFLNPRKDIFSMTFSTVVWFDRYWKLSFSTSSYNRNIYRYLKDYNPPDKDFIHVDFWQNLIDSINIFDYEALKRGYFKVQQFNFVLTHYILEEWELNISFNIQRKVETSRQIAYWEPSLLITFVLRGTTEQFPPYQKIFVPERYQ